jgi:hypothetical protein
MTVGPVVHTAIRVQDFNIWKAMLWSVASGEELRVARVPFWIDVRDSAEAYIEALLLPEAGNKRFTPVSPERFSYSLAAKIILKGFPWAKGQVKGEADQPADNSNGLHGESVTKILGARYRTFKQTVTDIVSQAYEINDQAK